MVVTITNCQIVRSRSLTHGAKYKFIAELRRPFAEHYKYRNRTTCMQRNRNQYNSSFFMVNMASGMDCGRVRPKTTTSHNMAAIQLIPSHAVLVYRLCYWTSMLWSIDIYQNKVSADQYQPDHIAGSGSTSSCVFLKLTKCQLSIGSRAHVRLINNYSMKPRWI